MKTSFGTVLAIVIVLAVAAFEYWQYKDAEAHRTMVNARLMQLSSRVEELDQNLLAAKREMRELESSSLGGIIDNANEALIQGWSAMIDTVEQELERARESFDQRQRRSDTSPAAPEQQDGAQQDGASSAAP